MIALYYHTKTPISFWCRGRLNLRSLIQPLEILTHKNDNTIIATCHNQNYKKNYNFFCVLNINHGIFLCTTLFNA